MALAGFMALTLAASPAAASPARAQEPDFESLLQAQKPAFAAFAETSQDGRRERQAAAAGDEASDKCCYCETGTGPENQTPFFKVGCNLWLGAQKGCKVKEIVEHGTSYGALPDFQCKGGT